MTIERLRELHEARPFRPFRIRVADGHVLNVPHPELLSHDGGRTIYVHTGPEQGEFVDLLLVTSLELGNGRSKRSRSS